MKITKEDAQTVTEAVREMAEKLSEVKHILRQAMSASEYEQFKYNCLAHVEPGLIEGSDWVGHYTSLEEIAERAEGDATPVCNTCETELDEDGKCPDCRDPEEDENAN